MGPGRARERSSGVSVGYPFPPPRSPTCPCCGTDPAPRPVTPPRRGRGARPPAEEWGEHRLGPPSAPNRANPFPSPPQPPVLLQTALLPPPCQPCPPPPPPFALAAAPGGPPPATARLRGDPHRDRDPTRGPDPTVADIPADRESGTLGKSPLAKATSKDVFPQPPSPTTTAFTSVSEGGDGLCPPPRSCCMGAAGEATKHAWPRRGRGQGGQEAPARSRVRPPPTGSARGIARGWGHAGGGDGRGTAGRRAGCPHTYGHARTRTTPCTRGRAAPRACPGPFRRAGSRLCLPPARATFPLTPARGVGTAPCCTRTCDSVPHARLLCTRSPRSHARFFLAGVRAGSLARGHVTCTRVLAQLPLARPQLPSSCVQTHACARQVPAAGGGPPLHPGPLRSPGFIAPSIHRRQSPGWREARGVGG